MNTPDNVSLNSSAGQKFIITPQMNSNIEHFISLCEQSSGSPIMIVGPTGSGKTLYLKEYEMMYRQECKSNKITPNVVWANCAHFGGKHSDPNIARAELFGYVKGAFDKAVKSSEGLLHQANNGLLILEEIGEMPFQVQAMFLTFLETNKFIRMGGKVIEESKMRIIGSTNRLDDLREDFKFRFWTYEILGLYKRREEILYFLYAKKPEVVRSLTGMQTLFLLSHNWPGSFRELERVANMIMMQTDSPLKLLLLESLNTNVSSISKSSLNQLLNKIDRLGADIDFLENVLDYNGINIEPKKPIFEMLPPDHKDISGYYEEYFEEKEGLPLFHKIIFEEIDAFENTFMGFMTFCRIFGQDFTQNSNLIENIISGSAEFEDFYCNVPNDEYDKFESLQKTIMMAMKDVYYESDSHPFRAAEFWEELKRIKLNIQHQSPSAASGKNEIVGLYDFNNLNEKQLLKKFYEQQLKFNSVKSLADRNGEPESTLRSKLDRIGVQFRTRHRKGKNTTKEN